MSSTNITEDDNKRRDVESQEQTDQNSAEQQPTSSGVRTQFNVKAIVTAKDSQERALCSNSLSSLDELAARLKDQFKKEDIERGVSIKTNNTEKVDNPLNTLKTTQNSRSLNDLLERLKNLKSKENSCPAIKVHTFINMAIASGSAISRPHSVISLENMLSKDREKLEDKDSFVTIDVCQKEKMTSTDVATVFSKDYRTQNMVASRNDYMNTPPPPYEYHQRQPQRVEYQGRAGQTPVYQAQNVEYGPAIAQDASRAPPYRSGDTDVENLFNTKAIRNKFIRKVYMILAIQLLFSFGFIIFCIYEPHTKKFVKSQWALLIASGVGLLVLMIMLSCYTTLRRIYPLNFILLALMTFCMAYMTAAISCYYETKIVMIAMGATGGICTLLSLIACQDWFDITKCGVVLCIASIIIVIYGIIAIIITIVTGSNIAYLIYAGLITLLFCVYLMYDTQQLLGGRRIELSPEEYILGAITLYVDVMIIFQYIMILSSHCR